MGCCKSRVLSEVYLVGMEPDKYFEIRIYESHRIMFHSINSTYFQVWPSRYASGKCPVRAVTKKQALEAFRTFVKIDTE